VTGVQTCALPISNLIRLSFGLGATARFAPDSHDFTRQLLAERLQMSAPVMDVLESFRWSSEWSLALTL